LELINDIMLETGIDVIAKLRAIEALLLHRRHDAFVAG